MNFTQIDIEKTLRKRKPTGEDVGKLEIIKLINLLDGFLDETKELKEKQLFDNKKLNRLLEKISTQHDANIYATYKMLADVLASMINDFFITRKTMSASIDLIFDSEDITGHLHTARSFLSIIAFQYLSFVKLMTASKVIIEILGEVFGLSTELNYAANKIYNYMKTGIDNDILLAIKNNITDNEVEIKNSIIFLLELCKKNIIKIKDSTKKDIKDDLKESLYSQKCQRLLIAYNTLSDRLTENDRTKKQ